MWTSPKTSSAENAFESAAIGKEIGQDMSRDDKKIDPNHIWLDREKRKKSNLILILYIFNS